MQELKNPHDLFFITNFSRPELTQEFCRRYLPQEILDWLDFSTLVLEKDNFVDTELQRHFPDLLYSIKTRRGQDAYIYILFEHKSYLDPMIALQLLRYKTQIWVQDQKVKQISSLRPILPLVIYHGMKKWSVPLDFQSLFPPNHGLEKYLPQFQYLLFDLSQFKDDRIQGNFMLRSVLFLLKYIHHSLLPQKLRTIKEWVLEMGQERERYREFLDTMLKYLYSTMDMTDYQQIEMELQDAIEKRGDPTMPTIAEHFIETGRKEGREEGREEGKVEGIRESIADILKLKFKKIPAHILEEINGIESNEKLRETLKKVFLVSSLKEFEQYLTSQK